MAISRGDSPLMPRTLGLELHTHGFSLATVAPGHSIDALALDDHDGVFAHTAARPWKWSLGAGDHDLIAVATGGQFFEGLEVSAGAASQLVVAIPSAWGERPRRSLLSALERSTLDPLRLVRETSALVVGASLAGDPIVGVCAVVDLGGHKLEVALAEVTEGMLKVLARGSIVGVEADQMGFGEVLPLIEELGRRLTAEAGLESRDVERVVATGRRLAMRSIAHGVEAIWGVPPEVAAPGTIARGAARIAAGLTGSLPPWLLDDDLDELPLSRVRPVARRVAPTLQAPVAPSTPAERIVSELPSVAPPGGAVASMPASGAFVGLPSLDAVRALDLVHAAPSSGLARPALVTLLNQFTFLRMVTGTLSLRAHDDELRLPIDRGGVCVSDAERPRALRFAEWSSGEFTWREEPLPAVVTKHRTPMTAFVVSALRVRLRAFDDAAFAEACGEKMSLSPSVVPGRRVRLERLALPEAEHRAVDHVVDGSRSFSTMLGEGYIGRVTLHRLVLLLDLYGILQWAAPTFADIEDPVEVMARTLTAMQRGNHFVALGVHWSAGPEEITGAWERLRASYGPDGRWTRLDPETAGAIVRRGSAAWAVLRDDDSRVRHRREAYPGMDETLLAPLVEARAKALEMRGEKSAAAEMSRLQREFERVLPTKGPPPKRG